MKPSLSDFEVSFNGKTFLTVDKGQLNVQGIRSSDRSGQYLPADVDFVRCSGFGTDVAGAATSTQQRLFASDSPRP